MQQSVINHDEINEKIVFRCAKPEESQNLMTSLQLELFARILEVSWLSAIVID